ncbi:MAG: hypothetical protein J7647_17795 [Cyanobacteria bacterium SBLK]|nr:hypothetical protein [Cyanobacteria bacterium SBLK]
MNKYLVEFPLDGQEGESVVIEVEGTPPPTPTDDRIGIGEDVIHKAKQTLDGAIAKIKPVANAIVAKVKEINEPADEVEVKFGLKMNAEVGAVIASGNAEATYEITLKWKKQS